MVEGTIRPIVPQTHANEVEHRKMLAVRANASFPKDGTEAMTAPLRLMQYTTPTLPPAAFHPGTVVYLSDTNSLAYSDGVNWIPIDVGLGWVTPEQFGAVGDGVADDTAAVQAAFSVTGAHVLLRQTYYITSTVTISGAGNSYRVIRGRGKTAWTLVSDQNITFIEIDCTDEQINELTICDMAIINTTAYGTCIGRGINVKGTAASGFNVCSFNDMLFLNLDVGFAVDEGVAGDVFVSWCQAVNLAFDGVNKCVYFPFATGTGWVLANHNAVLGGASAAWLKIGDGVGIVGDMTVVGVQMGGTGVGVEINGGSYGTNWSFTGMQFDAGITTAFILDNVHQFQTSSIRFGGGVTPLAATGGCSFIYIDYQEAANTFTPTITGSVSNPTVTYTEQYGSFQRIGMTCHMAMRVIINTYSGGSGDFQVSIPYAGDPNNYQPLSVQCDAVGFGGGTDIVALVLPGSPMAMLFAQSDGGGQYAVQIGDLVAGSAFHINGLYRMADDAI